MFLEELPINPWFIIVPFQMCVGHELQKVAVTGFIFCKEDEVIGVSVYFPLFVKPAPACYIRFHTNDGLDAGSFGFEVKLEAPVHGAMIGKSQSIHPELFGAKDELVQLPQAVKERKLTMCMKVDKLRHMFSRCHPRPDRGS